MENSGINNFWNLESSSYQNNHIHEPFGGLSPFNPFDLLPDPLLSDITTPSSSDSNKSPSSSLTGKDATHVDNLLFFGVDSPFLPPEIPTSTEMVPALGPVPLQPSDVPTTSSILPLPVSSSLFSPTTTDMMPSASPPAHERCCSLAEAPCKALPPTPGPSASRPAKRSRTSYAGESSFQLDPTVAPRPLIEPADQPVQSSYSRPDYSACQCPARLTSNRARHWRTSCPNNPKSRAKRFTCEECGIRFTREDNMKRHIEDYHR